MRLEAMEEEGALQPQRTRIRHIKKRALKNKALSVSFDEKDLREFVTGFQKRKKKRRKEARQQLEEAQRRKRIEARKKRKLEREFALYGGAPQSAGGGPDDDFGDGSEQDEDCEPIPSVSGTTTYENSNVKVIVTTSEISREEECRDEQPRSIAPRSIGEGEKKPPNVPVVKKKLFKNVAKSRSRPKPQSKYRRKGNKKNEKH